MKKILLITSAFTGLLAVFILVIILLTPLLVNTEAVRSRVSQWVGEKIEGKLSFDAIDLRFFPRSHVSISGVSGKFVTQAEVAVESLTLYLAFFPLLSGKVDLERLKIEKPVISLHLPVKAPVSDKDKAKNIDEIIDGFTSKFPELELVVEKGELKIINGEEMPLSIDTIAGTAATSKGSFGSDFTFTSEFADNLRVTLEVGKTASADKVGLAVQADEVEVTKLREFVTSLGSTNAVVQEVFAYLKSGSIPEISVQLKGQSFKDLGGFDGLSIKGVLKEGEVAVPAADLLFQDVSGSCAVSAGILRADGLSGETQGVQVYEGSLTVGLRGKDPEFYLDIGTKTDFVRIPPLLERFLSEKDFLFDRLQKVRGPVSGRLVIGESLTMFNEWQKSGHLQFDGRIRTESGPAIDIGLAAEPASFKIHKLNIKDLSSDAAFSAILGGGIDTFTFSGHLHTKTIDKLFNLPGLPIGSVEGSIEMAVNNEEFFRSTASGNLELHNLEFLLYERIPVRVDNGLLDFRKNRISIEVPQAEIADKQLALKGTADIAPQAMILDMDVSAQRLDWETLSSLFNTQGSNDSPLKVPFVGSVQVRADTFSYGEISTGPVQANVSLAEGETVVTLGTTVVNIGEDKAFVKGDIDILPHTTDLEVDVQAQSLHWKDLNNLAEEKPAQPENESEKKMELAHLSGLVRFAVDTLHFNDRKIHPGNGEISFLPDVIQLSVPEAMLCGVQAPGKINIEGEELELNSQLYAAQQDLEPTIRCFGENRSNITGKFDLHGTVGGRGKPSELVRQLSGNLDFRAEGGRIIRSPILLKVFSLLNVLGYFSGNIGDLFKEGMSYRSMILQADIREGKIVIAEAFLDAPSIEVTATGEIDLATEKIDLKMRAVPTTTVELVLGKVPVISKIVEGALISIPIEVSGDLDSPKVRYAK